MNRQIRRIEEKKERKAEKDKAKAKRERQARRRERSAQRQRSAEAAKKDGGGKDGGGKDGGPAKKASGPRTSNPGRFAGALTAATVFFIALQAVTPTDGTVASQVVSASFYLLFGYFSVLWMMRRGSPRPLAIAIGTAAAMGLVSFLSQWLQPALDPAPIMLALVVPLAVAGAFLGRLVWNRAP